MNRIIYPNTKLNSGLLRGVFVALGVLFINTLFGQIQIKNAHTFSLNVEDGLSQSRVENIVIDHQNILWIQLVKQLQYWDGQNVVSYQDSIIESTSHVYILPHEKSGVYVATPGLLRWFQYDSLKVNTLWESEEPYQSASSTPYPITYEDELYVYYGQDTLRETDSKQMVSSVKREKIHDELTNILSEDQGMSISTHPNFKNLRPYSSPIVTILTDGLSTRHLRYNYTEQDGQFFYVSRTQLLLIHDDELAIYDFPEGLKAYFYTSILASGNDKLCVGIDNRLFEFDIKNKTWTHEIKSIENAELLSTGFFDKIVKDNYGNKWAITVNEGLMKMYENSDFMYFNPPGKSKFIKNVATNDDESRVLVSMLKEGIVVFDSLGNILYELNSKNVPEIRDAVTGVFHTSGEKYIVNINNDNNIYELDLSFQNPTFKKILTKGATYLYYQDAEKVNEDETYFLFNQLYRYNTKNKSLDSISYYHSTKPAMTFAKGFLWIAAIDELIKFDPKTDSIIHVYKLPSEGYVRTVEHLVGERFAIGTDKGLSIYNIKTGNLTKLGGDCTYCLLVDELKNVWAGTDKGLIQYDTSGIANRYKIEDGIQGNEFNTNACLKGGNGRMYFGGLNGLTSFQVDELRKENEPNDLILKNLKVNNQKSILNSPLKRLTPMTLDHDEGNLSFKVGVNSNYESAVYNYQYAVMGLTDGWIDAQEQTEFNFNLAPGTYTFNFKGGSKFDENAKIHEGWKIKIKRPWWSAWWFYLISGCLGVGVISYLITSRQKQEFLREKYSWDLKNKLQEERLNMSKDLHDNIGTRLTFLVSSIENMDSLKERGPSTSFIDMKELAKFGKETINDLRSMMWVLAKDEISLHDLQLKILDFINVARMSIATTEFDFEGEQGENMNKILDSNLCQNVFRIVQEAIHNAVKHSNSEEVKTTIKLIKEKLIIEITDDGSGFDMTKEKNGNGLKNIRSRVEKYNGHCEIDSSLGGGTRLKCSFDL